jgi:hypothetical protein
MRPVVMLVMLQTAPERPVTAVKKPSARLIDANERGQRALGRVAPLPCGKRGPLRTVRASFPAYSSSLHAKPCLWQGRFSYRYSTSVHLLVAVRVEQYAICKSVRTAIHPIFQMVVVPARLFSQSRTTVRTTAAL